MTTKPVKPKSKIGLSPVPEGAAIVNKKDATLKFSRVYKKQVANTGYIWCVVSFVTARREGKKIINISRPEVARFQKPMKAVTIIGYEILSSFVKEHGEENVKNMFIYHIINNL